MTNDSSDEELATDARYYLEGLQKCMKMLDKRGVVCTVETSSPYATRVWRGMVPSHTYKFVAARVKRKEL